MKFLPMLLVLALIVLSPLTINAQVATATTQDITVEVDEMVEIDVNEPAVALENVTALSTWFSGTTPTPLDIGIYSNTADPCRITADSAFTGASDGTLTATGWGGVTLQVRFTNAAVFGGVANRAAGSGDGWVYLMRPTGLGLAVAPDLTTDAVAAVETTASPNMATDIAAQDSRTGVDREGIEYRVGVHPGHNAGTKLAEVTFTITSAP